MLRDIHKIKNIRRRELLMHFKQVKYEQKLPESWKFQLETHISNTEIKQQPFHLTV